MSLREPHRLNDSSYFHESANCRLSRDTIDQDLKLHWHEFFELSLIVEGRGEHRLNGDSVGLSPGALFLLTPADFHSITPRDSKAIQLFNFIFKAEFLSDEISRSLFSSPRRYETLLPAEQFRRIQQEFELIEEELRRQKDHAALMVRNAAERILLSLLRRSVPLEQRSSIYGGKLKDSAIMGSLLFLQYNFRNPISLEEAAAQANLSPHYYSERFHRALGLSFQTYLRELRLGLAKRLLITTDMPITEVCYASGFGSVSHFERSFKHTTGCSPGKFRAVSSA